MSGYRRQLVLAAILTGFAPAAQSAAAHSKPTEARFTVRVRNYARVSPKVMANAERLAADIFRSAGVESRWCDDPLEGQPQDSPEQTSPNLSTIWLNILSPEMADRLGRRQNVMGLALGTGSDRQVVDVLYGRLNELAREQQRGLAQGAFRPATTAELLAAVIAHEIGHVLLDGTAHSDTGIMRGNWDENDFYEVACGRLFFTSEQARLIRAEVVRRARTASDHRDGCA